MKKPLSLLCLAALFLLVSCAAASPVPPPPGANGDPGTAVLSPGEGPEGTLPPVAPPETETGALTVTGPAGTEPVETDPPVTEPVETDPPETEPPETEPPETEPPVTEPPVTEPPVTEPPVTEPPVTEPPETEPPVTEPPAVFPERKPVTDPEDKTAPVIFYLIPTVTLERGSRFNLHRYIAYYDDLDPDVQLLVDGEVDTALAGETTLSLTVRDHGGNEASARIKVRVTDPQPYVPPDVPDDPPEPYRFSDFAAFYEKDGAEAGIDVSMWQGAIDFERVAAAGCRFAVIRLGGYVEGEAFTDPYFEANYKNAKAAGLKVGVYWYSEENGPACARQNAEYLYRVLDGRELDFPVFFDWEDFAWFETYKMSLRDFREMFYAFREEAEARGYRAALYSSKYYLGLFWPETAESGSVWLAHYVDETTYTGDYFLWQQGIGRIDGIGGDVDFDVLYPERLKAAS